MIGAMIALRSAAECSRYRHTEPTNATGQDVNFRLSNREWPVSHASAVCPNERLERHTTHWENTMQTESTLQKFEVHVRSGNRRRSGLRPCLCRVGSVFRRELRRVGCRQRPQQSSHELSRRLTRLCSLHCSNLRCAVSTVFVSRLGGKTLGRSRMTPTTRQTRDVLTAPGIPRGGGARGPGR